MKRTPPNKPKPEKCEAPDCDRQPTCVLGGYWFCAEHGNRDYEKGGTMTDQEYDEKIRQLLRLSTKKRNIEQEMDLLREQIEEYEAINYGGIK